MVHLQTNGEECYNPFRLASSVSNPKKLKDGLESCPEINSLFEILESRDRKSILKCLEYVEFSSEVQ